MFIPSKRAGFYILFVCSNLKMNRGKRLLMLALMNKNLQEKFKTERSSGEKRKNETYDLDYVPESDESSDSSSCETEKKIVERHQKRHSSEIAQKKIKILSDITIESSCSHQPDANFIVLENDYQENTNFDIANNFSSGTNDESKNLRIVYIQSLLQDIFDNCMNIVERKLYTKTGELRKRKKYEDSPQERKRKKLQKYIKDHYVKESCKCPLKCGSKVTFERRIDINKQYWSMSHEEQKNFIYSKIKKFAKKRSTVKGENVSRRINSFKYSLTSHDNEEIDVCKVFFLATLGYEKENDRILKNVRNTDPLLIAPKKDRRCHPSSRKINREVIINHINSFHPTISHYRREHAPNRKYLPSDVSITFMFNDFKLKHPADNLSYEVYRKVVSDLNISFAKLGHEECWDCEEYKLHKKKSCQDEIVSECGICDRWKLHKAKALKGREEYQRDIEKSKNLDELFVAADLEKVKHHHFFSMHSYVVFSLFHLQVIMLPRMETFKEVVFTPRIIAFNESFVPLGKRSKKFPCAVLWHEAIAGRSQHEIISAFNAFFRDNRDAKSITIWLDNCSSQNKNWMLISFCIFIVNSTDVALEVLTLKFLEPGHTFLAADSFHHQVELSLKRKNKVYDFKDFIEAVQQANSAQVKVINMTVDDFYKFTDYTSKPKLQKLSPRVYLKNIVALQFKRGNKYFSYKGEFADNFEDLKDIYLQKYIKGTLSSPVPQTEHRGISEERKATLIAKLTGHVPDNRLTFWKDLPVNSQKPEEDEDQI